MAHLVADDVSKVYQPNAGRGGSGAERLQLRGLGAHVRLPGRAVGLRQEHLPQSGVRAWRSRRRAP